MKFRAVAGTDLVVSEIALAVGARSAFDPLVTERLVRLAYDAGVNLFCLPVGPLHDGAVASALSGGVRERVFLSAAAAWPTVGESASVTAAIDARLARLGTDRIDMLFLRDVPPSALADGAAGDAVHRLRAGGKVRCVGLSGPAGHPVAPRAAERSGATLIDFLADEVRGEAPRALALEMDRADAPGVSAVARFGGGFSASAAPAMSFLWNDTGRTPAQSLLSLALSSPWICAAAVAAESDDELRDVVRAPLVPAVTASERASLRAAGRAPALAEA